jgi:hypothetical protein
MHRIHACMYTYMMLYICYIYVCMHALMYLCLFHLPHLLPPFVSLRLPSLPMPPFLLLNKYTSCAHLSWYYSVCIVQVTDTCNLQVTDTCKATLQKGLGLSNASFNASSCTSLWIRSASSCFFLLSRSFSGSSNSSGGAGLKYLWVAGTINEFSCILHACKKMYICAS